MGPGTTRPNDVVVGGHHKQVSLSTWPFVRQCNSSSGVVKREHGGMPFPKYFVGNAIPPNDIRTRGNGDTVAFPQAGLQRNAKSMVS